MADFEEDTDYGPALCENCKKPLLGDWLYLLCSECAFCRHGNEPSECDECFYESDSEYDSRRYS
jgi:hypothetical protein